MLAAVAAVVVAPAGAKFAARQVRAEGTGGAAGIHDAVTTATAKSSGTVARIGRAYLREVPQEADATVLAGTLPTGFSATGTDWSLLQDQIATDYTSGGVVTIDGWHLSRTEARAAALSVLQG
jgi:hypothetical protein